MTKIQEKLDYCYFVIGTLFNKETRYSEMKVKLQSAATCRTHFDRCRQCASLGRFLDGPLVVGHRKKNHNLITAATRVFLKTGWYVRNADLTILKAQRSVIK